MFPRSKILISLAIAGLILGSDPAGTRAQALYDRDSQDEVTFPGHEIPPPTGRGRPRPPLPAVPPAHLLPPPELPELTLASPSPSPPFPEENASPSPSPTPRPDYLKTAEEIALEPLEEEQAAPTQVLKTIFQVQPRVLLPLSLDLQGLPLLIGGSVDWNFLPTGIDIFVGKMAVELTLLYGQGMVATVDTQGNATTLPVTVFDAGVGINYYFLSEALFNPYVGLGVSYFKINFTSGSTQLTTVTTPLHFRAGVDIMFFENAGITVELGYLYSPLRLQNYNPTNPGQAIPLDFPAAGTSPGPALAGVVLGLSGKIAF